MSIVNYIGGTFIAGRVPPTCLWILLLAATSFAAQPATVSSYHDPADLVRKAVTGVLRDSKTIAGILWLAQQRQSSAFSRRSSAKA